MSSARLSICLILLFFTLPGLASASESQLRQLPLTAGTGSPVEVLSALEEARPVSMASGDFDEDGVPDLLVS